MEERIEKIIYLDRYTLRIDEISHPSSNAPPLINKDYSLKVNRDNMVQGGI
jgi:hypothetical protein